MNKKQNVSIIAARPANLNTGMITVDLAAIEFFQSTLGADVNIRLFTIGALRDVERRALKLISEKLQYYDLLENFEQVLASDLIVYWGDFLQSYDYWMYELVPNLVNSSIVTSQNSAIEAVFRGLALEGQPLSVLKKVCLVGGTLFNDKTSSLTCERYWDALTRLLNNAAYISFRDSVSTARVAHLRPDSVAGVDCAFMSRALNYQSAGIAYVADGGASRKTLGVFFGRSPGMLNMLRFSSVLRKQLSYESAWIPWFRTRSGKIRLVASLFGLELGKDVSEFSEILTQVKHCDLIVTDTYHLAINAWRAGIPVICIGVGATHLSGSLGDKKKEIFYRSVYADDLYVFSEQLTTRADRKRIASELVQDYINGSKFIAVENRITEVVSAAKKRHISQIGAVLRSD